MKTLKRNTRGISNIDLTTKKENVNHKMERKELNSFYLQLSKISRGTCNNITRKNNIRGIRKEVSYEHLNLYLYSYEFP